MTVQGEKDSSGAGAPPFEHGRAMPVATHSRAPFHRSITSATIRGGVTLRGIASADNVNIGWVTIASKEADANMALWLAAPDLKTQLGIAVRWLAGMHSDADGDEITELREVHPDAWKCIDAMRAALAKAGA